LARVNITPSVNTPIIGYYVERRVEGVLDELEANAVAFRLDGKLAIVMSVDNCAVNQKRLTEVRKRISELTGADEDAIIIAATHTHTGPGASLTFGETEQILKDYWKTFQDKCVDAAYLAVNDLKPARMGCGVGEAKGVAFIRRFRMKDGSGMTNPGVNNPEIKEPLETVDERVGVIRIDREGTPTIIILNFGNHPDTVGGSLVSADWPGFARRFTEKAIENTRCVFFNGAQGDVNHVNVHPKGGDFNDMFNDFDGCSRGYGHARHIGRVIAAAAMQVYDKVAWQEVDSISAKIEEIEVPSNKPSVEELPLAKKYTELHESGRDAEIPYTGMALTTVVAEAKRMVQLEFGPDSFKMPLSILRLGKIAFVGFPGEPFTEIGRKTKETEGFDLILPLCCANDSRGYFPSSKAYEEGGYEARASRFAPGIAELLVSKAKEMLKKI
jgi:hypothetical protein